MSSKPTSPTALPLLTLAPTSFQPPYDSLGPSEWPCPWPLLGSLHAPKTASSCSPAPPNHSHPFPCTPNSCRALSAGVLAAGWRQHGSVVQDITQPPTRKEWSWLKCSRQMMTGCCIAIFVLWGQGQDPLPLGKPLAWPLKSKRWSLPCHM